MNSLSKKKLVIIYDEKSKSYANHLIQLIGMKDDIDEETIGIKAVMWDEKKYKDNEMTITSDEKLIFIGRSKNTRIVNEHSVKKYSKYGIEYGWLGNRAVITVDKKKIEKEDYAKFIDEVQLTVSQFEKKTKHNKKIDSTQILSSTIAGVFGVGSFLPIAFPLIGPAIWIPIVFSVKKKLKFQTEARKQRFNFAILNFYYNHLSKFVEE